MTRTVWAGPPLRRGLAWGVAVVLGAAALLAAGSGPDVTAKAEPPAKGALPADLALVPGDAFAFGTVRVADLWTDAGTKPLRDRLAKEFPEAYAELQKTVGVPPAEVERLSFVITKTP